MTHSEFPSGPWTGFYVYSVGGRKYAMDLTLTFSEGRITGDGADCVGLFIISGSYDPAGGECYWTKTYVGAHDVHYSGFREERDIWGTWEIPFAARGGFRIWPLGDAAAEEMEIEEEEPRHAEVELPQPSSERHPPKNQH